MTSVITRNMYKLFLMSRPVFLIGSLGAGKAVCVFITCWFFCGLLVDSQIKKCMYHSTTTTTKIEKKGVFGSSQFICNVFEHVYQFEFSHNSKQFLVLLL